MSRRIPCLVLLLFPVLVPAAPVVKGKAVFYHPTKVGDTRVYEMSAGGSTTETTDEVTKVEAKDGAFHVTVGRKTGGKDAGASTLEVSEQGVSRLASGGRALTSPARLLRLPARAGEAWTWETDRPDGAASQKVTYTMGKEEEVEVPAGKFKALRVDVETVLDGERVSTGTTWYAPGVGLVKSVTRSNDREFGYVLKSFAPGK